MAYIGRFAPSPTGPLHFGSLVAAVASWLDARAAGGQWHLRIEDVDVTRTVPGAESTILRQLEAFGLHWDGPVVRQSERPARYDEMLLRLEATNRVYRCRCSRKEIADSALRGIDGAVYPGTCRDKKVPDTESASVRFRVSSEAVITHDRVQGEIAQTLARELGDFVVKRRDGLYAYQLAVVIDDADLGVTDIVRGADLLESTPRQIALQHALGLTTPRYLHVPVVTRNGEKLSKQTLAPAVDASLAMTALRESLAYLGQEPGAGETVGALLREAVMRWDPSRIPRTRVAELPPTL